MARRAGKFKKLFFFLQHPPQRYWKVGLALFLLYMAASGWYLISLPLPAAYQGLKELKAGKASALHNSADASRHFQAASSAFSQSFQRLQTAPWWSKLVAPLPPFRWQVQLMKASQSLANAGDTASQLSGSFPHLDVRNAPSISALLSQGSFQYFTWQQKHIAEIAQLADQLTEADKHLSGVPNLVGLHRAKEIKELKNQVEAALAGLKYGTLLSNQLNYAFGAEDAEPHTFLILFQNNSELRPSGGFLGSYAVITTSSGTIRQFQFGTDIYKLDKPFIALTKIPAPVQLRTINPYLSFHDSNGGAGFLPEIAPQVANLYEQETGLTVDGLIFTDTSILEDILTITGPLVLPGIKPVTVDASNVRQALTQQIEKDYFTVEENIAANEPKQVLADFLPLLIAKLADQPNALPKLLPKLENQVKRKSLQFWFANLNLQGTIDELTPTDSPPDHGNWLKIVNSNIGGFKSSTNVEQRVKITQKTDKLKNRLVQTVVIERRHTGDGIWPDAENKNYMEIYFPAEAQVVTRPENQGGDSPLKEHEQLEAGILNKVWKAEETDTEAWKKLGFWASTPPGKTTSYTFVYTLPLLAEYRRPLTYLKQAGSVKEEIEALDYTGPVEQNLVLGQ